MARRRWLSVLALTRSLLVIVSLAGCGGGDSGGGGGGGQRPSPMPARTKWQRWEPRSPWMEAPAKGLQGAGLLSMDLNSKPSGSTATLTSPTSARPTFTPDVAGAYTATLVVQANSVASQPDTVSITFLRQYRSSGKCGT